MPPITEQYRRAPLLGIVGPLGAGKSAFLAGLVAAAETYRVKIVPNPMAGPLKQIASYMGWNGQKDDKGRRLLQLLGTECGRECVHENLWVNTWATTAYATVLRHKWNPSVEIPLVVADDVRFLNEALLIDRLGGHLIEILRPKTKFSPEGHGSEQGFKWPETDPETMLPTNNILRVHNDGDLDGLRLMAKDWLLTYLEEQRSSAKLPFRKTYQPTLQDCVNSPRLAIPYPPTPEEAAAAAAAEKAQRPH